MPNDRQELTPRAARAHQYTCRLPDGIHTADEDLLAALCHLSPAEASDSAGPRPRRHVADDERQEQRPALPLPARGTLVTWARTSLGLTVKTVSRPKVRVASCCCRAGGSWSAPSHGSCTHDGWSEITRGCPSMRKQWSTVRSSF
ncbi:hypothetical protein GCM10010245_67420 [Streptomyces spectabilis]|nr:hypothetical protein GCM10010245_67420 [Streptomyces spectabilis]